MVYQYTAIDSEGDEVSGVVSATDQNAAIDAVKAMGHLPVRIIEIKEKHMNLAQALKQKNRLAGELVRQQQILQRENARRSDSVSNVDRDAVWTRILDLSTQLGELKGKITAANIGIYSMLERMAELKARISFIQGLDKREGEEVTSVGYNSEKLVYTWNSCINQEKCDQLVMKFQEEINAYQDQVDAYNATTTIA